MPLVLYFTCCKLFVILIWKYCLINMMPFSYSLGNMLYVNKAQWHGNTMNEQFLLERNKIMSRWCILLRNKKLRTFVFVNWNKTRMNSCWEMGKSSSNVPNVLKGSLLTGHRICRYWESRADIYYILWYFLIHYAYSKILNANKFSCLRGNIYLSEVSISSFLVCNALLPGWILCSDLTD